MGPPPAKPDLGPGVATPARWPPCRSARLCVPPDPVRARFLLLTLLAGLLAAGPARSQHPQTLSDEAQVSLLTILPGDQVYSMYGHSAIRIVDPVLGLDWTYNYGTFDFGHPLTFVPRFVQGRLDYFLSVASYPRALAFYRTVEQRPVIEQVLALDATQRQALFDLLQVNARPENRTYRYDFLFDNCATRIRDVMEATLGEALHFDDVPPPNRTFRQLLDPYAADRPFLDFGIDLALGTPVDRIASARESMFLPDYLQRAFAHATLTRDGQTVPLVARTDTVFWTDRPAARAWPWPALLLWTLFAVGLGWTVRTWSQPPARRWPDAWLFGLVGVAGVLLLYLWAGTEHTVTRPNWNLAWAWPTHLVAAVWLSRRGGTPLLRRYFAATALATVVFLIGFVALPQSVPGAAIPLLLLLALRALWWARPRSG